MSVSPYVTRQSVTQYARVATGSGTIAGDYRYAKGDMVIYEGDDPVASISPLLWRKWFEPADSVHKTEYKTEHEIRSKKAESAGADPFRYDTDPPVPPKRRRKS